MSTAQAPETFTLSLILKIRVQHQINCILYGDADETYVLCDEEIQYWDSGLFMSSGTTLKS